MKRPITGTRGDAAAAELIARIDRATAMWNDSCPRADAHGLCIELASVTASADRCEPPELGTVVVHPRDPEMSRAAQVELAEVMEIAACASEVSCDREVLDVQPDDLTLARTFRRALATARLVRADADLASTLPVGPSSAIEVWARDPNAASMAAIESFYETKMESGRALMENLTLVKLSEDDESILRASLRVSWALLHVSDELRASPIPASLGEYDPLRESYCAAMRERAREPRAIAIEAASYCRNRADLHGSTSETAQECRDLLERLHR